MNEIEPQEYPFTQQEAFFVASLLTRAEWREANKHIKFIQDFCKFSIDSFKSPDKEE